MKIFKIAGWLLKLVWKTNLNTRATAELHYAQSLSSEERRCYSYDGN